MSSPLSTDKEIIAALGVDVLVGAGYSLFAVKKWRSSDRGIPWKERGKIAKLAARNRIKLPADFAEERRAA
jgi:hypothetical protein